MDQGLTCEACNRQLPPAAFRRDYNGVRNSLCNSCRPLQQRRRQQQQSPPNFQLILSQPADTSFCSSCQRYRPIADFQTNRVGAPYPTCTTCSAVRCCPPPLRPVTDLLLTCRLDRAAPADVRDAPLLQTRPPLHDDVPAVSPCRRLL